MENIHTKNCSKCGPSKKAVDVTVCVRGHFLCDQCIIKIFNRELVRCIVCNDKLTLYRDVNNYFTNTGFI